jgi:hypothetical protein
MRELPDGADPRGIDPSVMLQRRFGEYWDSDRATYEDELNAWRDRTAAAVAPAAPAWVRAVAPRRVAARTASPRRPRVAPRRLQGWARRREAMTNLANQPSRDS